MVKRWNDARSVVVLCADTPSAVLAASPAIRALRDRMPGGRVTLLTGPQATPYAKRRPISLLA